MASDMAVIRDDFSEYLRGLGYAAFTVEHYLRRLVRVEHWLREQRRRSRLGNLTRRMVPRLLRDFLPGRHPETVICYRKVLFHWLRFQGRSAKTDHHAPWQRWLTDFIDFLQTHRGVGPSTVEHSTAIARDFLRWQFGRGEAEWSRLRTNDIWRFAQHDVIGVKPTYAKGRLGHLRRFLSFVHLRGGCSADLAKAVPRVAVGGDSTRPEILSELQRRELLSSFPRRSPESKRDFATTLCMLDLGLRGAEVVGLRLRDIDWRGRSLNVPATKTGRGRQLPMPKHIFTALRDYVKKGRPTTGAFDHVFVRHPRRVGHPLSRSALKAMVTRAYHNCGFPKSWSGTHRLRHTFVSRLHRRGADMKQLADLLGHRRLNSTNTYTQVGLDAMGALAQPWPR